MEYWERISQMDAQARREKRARERAGRKAEIERLRGPQEKYAVVRAYEMKLERARRNPSAKLPPSASRFLRHGEGSEAALAVDEEIGFFFRCVSPFDPYTEQRCHAVLKRAGDRDGFPRYSIDAQKPSEGGSWSAVVRFDSDHGQFCVECVDGGEERDYVESVLAEGLGRYFDRRASRKAKASCDQGTRSRNMDFCLELIGRIAPLVGGAFLVLFLVALVIELFAPALAVIGAVCVFVGFWVFLIRAIF